MRINKKLKSLIQNRPRLEVHNRADGIQTYHEGYLVVTEQGHYRYPSVEDYEKWAIEVESLLGLNPPKVERKKNCTIVGAIITGTYPHQYAKEIESCEECPIQTCFIRLKK